MKRLPTTPAGYRTADSKAPLLARTFPSLSFYRKMAAIVWRSGSLAKRGRYGDAEWNESSHDVLRALEGVGVRFEITGIDHVEDLDGPCVVVGNHMSVLETFVLPGVIRPIRPVTFIVKESLLGYPVFGHVMRSRDPVAVTRTHPRQDFKTVMELGKERLGKGISLVVFPQTTRHQTLRPAEFNSIGVKLAQRTNVPVVPLAVLTDAWGVGRWIKDVGRIDPSKKVHLAFGKPLSVQGRGGEEHEAVISFIQRRLEEWRDGRG
jgi:1-acyl-sn-glycerol-3-phosphate acyltransferase